MKRAHIKIRGKVQGVGFRAWMLREATSLSLTGYVMNLDDGSVEALVEGEEMGVNLLVELCKEGPKTSKVDDVEVSFSDYLGEFETFFIKR